MGDRRGTAQIFLVTVLVASVVMMGSHTPNARMYASDGNPADQLDALGWLKGRVTDAFTGLGLTAIIVASSLAHSWAGGTDHQGYYAVELPRGTYSVTALKGRLSSETKRVEIFRGRETRVDLRIAYAPVLPTPKPSSPQPTATPRPLPAPTPSPNPSPPSPSPSRWRSPHLISTRIGSGWPMPDTTTAPQFAFRYDVIFYHETISRSVMNALRAANPSIILLQYYYPAGFRTWLGGKPTIPLEHIVRDETSGLRTKRDTNVTWWTINIPNPATRGWLLDHIASVTSPGSDGYWLDNADGALLNYNWYRFTDESGKCADFGPLDGGWDCSKPRSTAISFTDGTWPQYMLQFHREMKARFPGKIRLFNGSRSNQAAYLKSATHENNILKETDGIIMETMLVKPGGPVPESDWKWSIDRAKAIVESGKYVWFSVDREWEETVRLYGFASYLLFADGKYAWFHIYQPHYSAWLFDVDYGAPLGPYTVIETPTGRLYKRQFTRATVWVNPGNVTRSADGKTLGPKSALLETR